MIKAIIIVNNQGKPRLTKFYDTNLSDETKQQLVRECYQAVAKRSDSVCNFLEGGKLWGKDSILIYRHYSSLYFVFVADSSESELGILDLMQVFVEALDSCFKNVCELDLFFHSDQVHYILDELILGGMVLETNLTEILTSVEAQKRLENKTPLTTGLNLKNRA